MLNLFCFRLNAWNNICRPWFCAFSNRYWFRHSQISINSASLFVLLSYGVKYTFARKPHTHTLLSSSFFCEIIFPSIYVNACRLLLRTHYIEIITISSLSLSSSLLQQQQEQQQWRFSIWQIWLAQIIIANDCVACMHKHCKKKKKKMKWDENKKHQTHKTSASKPPLTLRINSVK